MRTLVKTALEQFQKEENTHLSLEAEAAIEDYLSKEHHTKKMFGFWEALSGLHQLTAGMESLTPTQFELTRIATHGIMQTKRPKQISVESFTQMTGEQRLAFALEEQKGILTKLWEFIKSFFKAIGDFFKKLFGFDSSASDATVAKAEDTAKATEKVTEDFKKTLESKEALAARAIASMDGILKDLDNKAKAVKAAPVTTQDVKAGDDGKTLKQVLNEVTDVKAKGETPKEPAQMLSAAAQRLQEIEKQVEEMSKKKGLYISFDGLAMGAPIDRGFYNKPMLPLAANQLAKGIEAIAHNALKCIEYSNKFEMDHLNGMEKFLKELLAKLKDASLAAPDVKGAMPDVSELDDMRQKEIDKAWDWIQHDMAGVFPGDTTKGSITWGAGVTREGNGREREGRPTVCMSVFHRQDAPKEIRLVGSPSLKTAPEDIRGAMSTLGDAVVKTRKHAEAIAKRAESYNFDAYEKAFDEYTAKLNQTDSIRGQYMQSMRVELNGMIAIVKNAAANYAALIKIQEQIKLVFGRVVLNVAGLSAVGAKTVADEIASQTADIMKKVNDPNFKGTIEI